MPLDTDKISILIADDNDTDRLLLSTFVTKLGHQVLLASDGQEAVERYEKERPHIILLDALMPKMTGFEAALNIKQIAGTTFVPIIFLTSLSDAESLVKGLRAGGDDFLTKPYNHLILGAKIDAFNRMRVNHHRLQKALEDLETSQARLVEREKMASLGELVAGVAHEVNTPIGVGITAISYLGSELSLLQKKYEEGLLTEAHLQEFLGRAKESVGITHTNLKRAASLVNSFKQVAVDQSNNKARLIHLKRHMDDVILSLHPQLKMTNHKIKIDCSTDLTCICDAGALTQVVSNLVTNSIVHGFEGRKEGCINMTLSLQKEIIKLTYKDNGIGMKQAQLIKIFEPFYTTKRGQGACGLGAHIIYNQVNQNLGGQIKVSSSEGIGVLYEIEFPQNASLCTS